MGPRPQGFPGKYRLAGPAEFRYVFARARKFSSREFTVLVRRNPHAYPRLGLAISRKCAPRAVTRNRVKRIIREGFRRARAGLEGCDIVFLGKKGIADRTNTELGESVRHLLSEIGQCKLR